MVLFKFEFVFATIMGIQKHVVMRLDRETSSAIFFLWFDRVRGLTASVAWPSCYGLTVYEKIIFLSSFFRKRSSHSKTVELVFTTIMDIRKNMLIRLDLEISSAIFYYGLTVCVAWPLVWLECLVVAWRFTEKKYCARGIQYFSSSCPINKLTKKISYSNKVLRTFRHGTLNSHVPGINFLEFLLHALSIKSYHNWYWQSTLVNTMLYLQKIPSIIAN